MKERKIITERNQTEGLNKTHSVYCKINDHYYEMFNQIRRENNLKSSELCRDMVICCCEDYFENEPEETDNAK